MPIIPPFPAALARPRQGLGRRFIDRMRGIGRPMGMRSQEHTAPFYPSADRRNAGLTLAAVDTNPFPDGLNTLDRAPRGGGARLARHAAAIEFEQLAEAALAA